MNENKQAAELADEIKNLLTSYGSACFYRDDTDDRIKSHAAVEAAIDQLAMLAQAAAPVTGAVPLRELDVGPWSSSEVGNVMSADFKHDVILHINGDFADKHERKRYGEALAATLNGVAAPAQPAEPVDDAPTSAEEAGGMFLAWGADFRDACKREGLGDAAVRWVTGEDGELAIFTRGEYRFTLMRNIDDVGCEEHRFAATSAPPQPAEVDALPELRDLVLKAIAAGPHAIERRVVELEFDSSQPGTNALQQLANRIVAALAIRAKAPVCTTCNDHGAVGVADRSEPCPDCTPVPGKPAAWLKYPPKKPALARADMRAGLTAEERGSGWVEEPLCRLASIPAPSAAKVEGADEDLHAFVNAAAGDGLVIGGVDAADLYVKLWPERYAAALRAPHEPAAAPRAHEGAK